MQVSDIKKRRVAMVTLAKNCRLEDDLTLLERSLLIELKSKLGRRTWNVEKVEIVV